MTGFGKTEGKSLYSPFLTFLKELFVLMQQFPGMQVDSEFSLDKIIKMH